MTSPSSVEPEETSWAPTRALGRAVLFGGLAAFAGVILGRVDLVVLAAPFAIGVAWGLRRRPARPPVVAAEIAEEDAAEGGAVGVALELSNEDPVPLDLVVGRLATSPWLQMTDGARPYAGDVAGAEAGERGADRGLRPAGSVRRVDLRATALRWGYQQVGPAVAYGVAGDGLLVSGTVVAPALTLRVYPAVPPFRADSAMPRSAALVGVHRSRRPGEDGELSGVRRYAPGDRLRRIDWRVTLRTRDVHVAASLSDRDAEVIVLLDVLHEAGVSGGIRGEASVVDTAVRAAAAICDHYLRQGDRVGLVEYSGRPRYLRPASGRRQLITALDWLLDIRAGAGVGPTLGLDPSIIPNAALVVVLTPLLGPQSTETIATLARAGRSVVAVDTLGSLGQRRMSESRWTPVAQRLWWLERQNLIGLLHEAGVPVTAWIGPGSLDQVLHDMARMAAAGRLGGR
ncbi:MAG: DUF58 domain-containing protein [Micromonosporaceae bacterium]|nr:DUF58 domain-containing protein [Micromonosporaceae bacterium]